MAEFSQLLPEFRRLLQPAGQPFLEVAQPYSFKQTMRLNFNQAFGPDQEFSVIRNDRPIVFDLLDASLSDPRTLDRIGPFPVHRSVDNSLLYGTSKVLVRISIFPPPKSSGQEMTRRTNDCLCNSAANFGLTTAAPNNSSSLIWKTLATRNEFALKRANDINPPPGSLIETTPQRSSSAVK